MTATRTISMLLVLLALAGCPERLAWRAGLTAPLTNALDSVCIHDALSHPIADTILHSSTDVYDYVPPQHGLLFVFIKDRDTLSLESRSGKAQSPYVSVGRTWPRQHRPTTFEQRTIEARARPVIAAVMTVCKTSVPRGETIEVWSP